MSFVIRARASLVQHVAGLGEQLELLLREIARRRGRSILLHGICLCSGPFGWRLESQAHRLRPSAAPLASMHIAAEAGAIQQPKHELPKELVQ